MSGHALSSASMRDYGNAIAELSTGTCRSPFFSGRPHTVGGHQPSSIACALRASRALTWGIHAMKLPRRRFLHLAAGAAALPAVSRIARAQAYPTRPVRIIVGFPAGGPADIIARLIGQWLSERLGQPFIIENRPGAGSNIATEAVVRCAAGRLHAAAGRSGERDQRDALRQAQLQFHPRHRAGRGHQPRAQRHGGQSIGSGQDRSRVHRLRQGQSGQAQHGVGRHRHRDPISPASCSR